jgi:hypothetical protein
VGEFDGRSELKGKGGLVNQNGSWVKILATDLGAGGPESLPFHTMPGSPKVLTGIERDVQSLSNTFRSSLALSSFKVGISTTPSTMGQNRGLVLKSDVQVYTSERLRQTLQAYYKRPDLAFDRTT